MKVRGNISRRANKSSFCIALAFLPVFLLLTAEISKADLVYELMSRPRQGKLIDPEEIMKGFEQGQERVKIFINLPETEEIKELKATIDWNSRESLKRLQDAIRAIEDPFLSSLSESEFRLRCRFDNQVGFSGAVTRECLEKLMNDPQVESIEPVLSFELYPQPTPTLWKEGVTDYIDPRVVRIESEPIFKLPRPVPIDPDEIEDLFKRPVPIDMVWEVWEGVADYIYPGWVDIRPVDFYGNNTAVAEPLPEPAALLLLSFGVLMLKSKRHISKSAPTG